MKNLLNYQEMMTMQQKIYRLFVSSKPKLIGSDLRQTNTSIPQQINFWGKLKDDHSAAIFLIAEKTKKNKKVAKNYSQFFKRFIGYTSII